MTDSREIERERERRPRETSNRHIILIRGGDSLIRGGDSLIRGGDTTKVLNTWGASESQP
jgi:hypothetical protein